MLAFYVGKPGFELDEDIYQPAKDKRWVTDPPPPTPPPSSSPASPPTTKPSTSATRPAAACPLLATPLPRKDFAASLLATDDFERDHARFTAAGVEWVRLGARQRPALTARLRPTDHDYGRVAVWKDLYGNLWDLVQVADRA